MGWEMAAGARRHGARAGARAAAAQAESRDGATGLPAEQIEKIVRDYLMREPEIIYQALEELQRRQAEAAGRAPAHWRSSTNREQLINDAGDPVAGNPDGNVTAGRVLRLPVRLLPPGGASRCAS